MDVRAGAEACEHSCKCVALASGALVRFFRSFRTGAPSNVTADSASGADDCHQVAGRRAAATSCLRMSPTKKWREVIKVDPQPDRPNIGV